MRIGVADYGMNVWDGGCFDIEERLVRLKEIGFEGVERLEAISADQAIGKAAVYRRLGMDFTTCRGPTPETSIEWTAALGKPYVWAGVNGKDFDTFCRQANIQVKACARYGLRVGLHNHLGSLVESQAQLEEFLARCPECGLVLDTGHLAAAGGDPIDIVRRYASRLAAVHVKEWLVTKPSIGLDRWQERGRFCELGAGNSGQDHPEFLKELVKSEYDGWIFVEHDTHLRESLLDLAVSRQYLHEAGM
ncbi:MAG: sugar phosphate isomerase/epimerase [Verrucomicrobia bacterium]|nr:sugar phosphate isomerase/epimerase [Verrucomicrobiota bacterium]MBU4291743.1 sugar phosphate isomerase/epimerase [Verrucomicrobiota bacterium]MBU4429049.1 sugar phosphate isomerase/epimerase [Verrucomicrobiota bacterium]MCG2679333.1 sugar phosphate isomerase/epimerase [Kiritimatiellia bacterium]